MHIDYDRNAAHSAQWQDLELILRQLLQHRNTRYRRERVAYTSLIPVEAFMRACMRPTEAACFRIKKCANNHQLIVASIQRFLQYAYAARFRVIHTCETLHARRVFTQKVIGIFFVHGNGNRH